MTAAAELEGRALAAEAAAEGYRQAVEREKAHADEASRRGVSVTIALNHLTTAAAHHLISDGMDPEDATRTVIAWMRGDHR